MITKLGLNFYTTSISFTFEIEEIEKDENGTILFQENVELSEFMHDFFSIFSIEKENEKMKIYPIVCKTNEVSKKFNDYFLKYKEIFPKIFSLKKEFDLIKENEYFIILPSWEYFSTNDIINLKRKLYSLNNEEMPAQDDDFFDLIDRCYDLQIFGDFPRKFGHKKKTDRICRWCHRSINSPDKTTFKSKAHAISEALGNKKLILLDECDECNNKFSQTIEMSIINYLSFFNTLCGVNGKGGYPKIKNSDIIIEKLDENRIEIIGSSKCIVYKDGKPSSLSFNMGKVIFQDIYKSLVKYALSVIDSSIIDKFKWTIDWLNRNAFLEKLPIVKVNRLLPHVFYEPQIQLYLRKNDNSSLPLLFVVLYCNITAFLYIVPSSKEELSYFIDEQNYEKFWKELHFFNKIKWEDSDFSSNKKYTLVYNLNFKKRNK